MGIIPSQIALLTKLGKCNVIWYFVVMIVVMCVSLYSHACVFSFFIPSDLLDLYDNSLTGTIPSQIALMSNLGESSVVWLFVVMIVLSYIFHCTLMLACHFSFYRLLGSLRQ
jgi:hypothetical protein